MVSDPRLWASTPGLEFWATFKHADVVNTMGSANEGWSGHGWGMFPTSGLVTDGSAGDVLSAADNDPTALNLDGSFGSATSACVFGGYDHALAAKRFLGYMPTTLSIEVFASFTTVANNDNSTYIGFTSALNTNCIINSDGTNFRFQDDVASDLGATADTAWHLFGITINASDMEWFIDGVSQGTLTTQADRWPALVALVTGAGSNRLKVAWCRVYYR